MPIIYTMRNLMWYLLALHFLSGNILLAELGKLPFVLQHFQVHQVANPFTDFSTFLDLHYRDNQHRKSDTEHHHLPLLATHASPVTVTLLPELPEPVLHGFPLPEESSSVIPWDQLLTDSGFRPKLLKPPAV